MAAQSYAERYGARQPLTVLYRPARQAWLRTLEEAARARPHLATAPATLAGVRQLLRALKRGETSGCCRIRCPRRARACGRPSSGGRPTP
jgi:KDO2-lipid IV(A) lauroyltransferase